MSKTLINKFFSVKYVNKLGKLENRCIIPKKIYLKPIPTASTQKYNLIVKIYDCNIQKYDELNVKNIVNWSDTNFFDIPP